MSLVESESAVAARLSSKEEEEVSWFTEKLTLVAIIIAQAINKTRELLYKVYEHIYIYIYIYIYICMCVYIINTCA